MLQYLAFVWENWGCDLNLLKFARTHKERKIEEKRKIERKGYER